MEEWKEYKLGEIANFTTGKLNSNAAVENGKYPFFTCSPQTFRINDYAFDQDAILLAGNNAEGKFNIKRFSGKFNAYQRTYVISEKDKNEIDLDYLFYALKLYLNEFKHISQGTATKFLTAQILNAFPIQLPTLETQQKIAAILSSLDEKIELNNKINTNLEQQAQALFKNWFVDFEPFGGKMPEGWKVGKLSEYCNFQEGYVNPAQTHNEYFDGDVKWLRAVDINESFILNTSRTLTKCGFESAGKSAFLFKPGSIAISKSGTVGRLGIISDFMCGNRAVIGIELKEQQNLSYIHQYLKSRQTEFPDMAVGSVQKNLYVSILENLDIIIPSKEVLEKFAAICIPFYDQIKTNCVENNNLSSIRDTLLPKLMNGEIEV